MEHDNKSPVAYFPYPGLLFLLTVLVTVLFIMSVFWGTVSIPAITLLDVLFGDNSPSAINSSGAEITTCNIGISCWGIFRYVWSSAAGFIAKSSS